MLEAREGVPASASHFSAVWEMPWYGSDQWKQSLLEARTGHVGLKSKLHRRRGETRVYLTMGPVSCS